MVLMDACVLAFSWLLAVTAVAGDLPLKIHSINLNKLELEASHSNSSHKSIMAYERFLSHFRGLNIATPDKTRVDFLGKKLCTFGKSFDLQKLKTNNKKQLAQQWIEEIEALVAVESNDATCAVFYDYHKMKWRPTLFAWTMASFLEKSWRDSLMSDEYFTSIWANAFLSGSIYLKGHTPLTIDTSSLSIRPERTQHVYHLHILFRTTGYLVSDFKQIVEFGGGTGDNIAVFQELFFAGTHFIIDLPPMLHLQQYFARYSNWPAYIGDDLVAGIGNRNMILENSLNLAVFDSHVKPESASSSLFIATFSLTEAPSATRKEIIQRVNKFGVLFLAFARNCNFCDGDERIDDVADMVKLSKELKETHSSCVWPIPNQPDNFYIVFTSLQLNKPVKCSAVVGCSAANLVHGEGCVVV